MDNLRNLLFQLAVTPTHRTKDQPQHLVTAWQRHAPRIPVPIWVCRKFHDLDGSGQMVAAPDDGDDLVELRLTDWAVCIEVTENGLTGRMIMVVPDPTFQQTFEPIP